MTSLTRTAETRDQNGKRAQSSDNYTAVKQAVQNTYKHCRSRIQEVHPVPHSKACNFCHFFIPVLSRSYFTFRTLFKSYKPETSMSTTVNISVYAICKCSKKCLVQNVGHLDSLGPIPTYILILYNCFPPISVSPSGSQALSPVSL